MAASDSKATHQDGPDELSQMKRKLAWRMGVAGLMIVALLGSLALFDRLAMGPGEAELAEPRFTEPVPVPKKTVTQAVSSAEPTPPADKQETAAPESTSAPADRAVPTAAEPSPPVAAAHPPAVRPTAKPATGPKASDAKNNDVAVAVPSRSEQPLPAGGGAAAGQRHVPVLPKLVSGYTLQAGVFADPRRAEDVYARLVQEGIPAALETRVLVGPFRSRDEAETARAKMLVLGIDSLPLPRSGKK